MSFAGYWKEGSWNGLTNPNGPGRPYNAVANSVIVSGSNIYAGGYSMTSSGGSDSGDWSNGTWANLTAGSGGAINAIKRVVACRLLDEPHHWNGFTNPVSSSHNAQVASLVVSGGVIYSVGYGDDSSGTHHAVYWNTLTQLPNRFGSSYESRC